MSKHFIASIFLCWLLCANSVWAQKKSTIDSLQNLLEVSNDSAKVEVLRMLCWEYRNLDTRKALAYGNKALTLATKLKIFDEQADLYNRLGVIKRNQGQYAKSLDYYFKALEIAQKNKLTKIQSFAFNNIADIYNRIGIYQKALEYGFKALYLGLQLGDDYNLSYVHFILGQIYENKLLPDSALFQYKEALQLRIKLKRQSGIASSYSSIADVYFIKNELDSSFIYYNRAIAQYIGVEDRTGLASCNLGLGNYYNAKKEYKKAVTHFNISYNYIKDIGELQIQKEISEGLKFSYSQLGDYKNAYYYQELAIKLKDSINDNIFVQKIIQLTENYKFEIKQQEQEIIREQKEAMLQKELSFQRKSRNFYLAATLVLMMFAGVVIYFYKQKSQAFRILKKQKAEIAQLNEGLIMSNAEIVSHKEEIESQRDDLQKHRDQLQQLNATKDKLFSIIAHDLRNPFNVIIGFLDIMQNRLRKMTFEESESMLKKIYLSAGSAYNLLESLLDWAKTQTNQVNVSFEVLEISSVVENVLWGLQSIASNKSISLSFSKQNDIFVLADSNMLNTIFRNLITNSIKFTPKGGAIVISASSNSTKAEICVSDNGVGMKDEIKNSLFTANVNPSGYGTNKEKGSGLGLVICREFVEKQGGTIWVESELGKGSNFKFTLPISNEPVTANEPL